MAVAKDLRIIVAYWKKHNNGRELKNKKVNCCHPKNSKKFCLVDDFSL